MKLDSFIDSICNKIKSKNHDKPIAVFDFDNTCIIGDIGDSVLNYSIIENLIDYDLLLNSHDFWNFPNGNEKRADANELLHKSEKNSQEVKEFFLGLYWDLVEAGDRKNAYPLAAKFLAGKSIEEIHAISINVFKEAFKIREQEYKFGKFHFHKGIAINDSVFKFMKKLRESGVEIFIVSATNKFIIEAVAKEFFKIPSENVMGITPSFDGQNLLTSKIDESVNPITFMDGKVDAIKLKLGKVPVLAIGDSIGDFSMMKYASDYAIILDKGDGFFRNLLSQEEIFSGKWIIVKR